MQRHVISNIDLRLKVEPSNSFADVHRLLSEARTTTPKRTRSLFHEVPKVTATPKRRWTPSVSRADAHYLQTRSTTSPSPSRSTSPTSRATTMGLRRYHSNQSQQ